MVVTGRSSPQHDDNVGKNCVKRRRSSGSHSSLKRQRVSLEGSRGEENFKTVQRPLPMILPAPSLEGAELPLVSAAATAVAASAAAPRTKLKRQQSVATRRKTRLPIQRSSRLVAPIQSEGVQRSATTGVVVTQSSAVYPPSESGSSTMAYPRLGKAPAAVRRPAGHVPSMTIAAISAAVNQAARTEVRPFSTRLVRLAPVQSVSSNTTADVSQTSATSTPKRLTSASRIQSMPSPVSRPEEHLAATVLQGLAPEARKQRCKASAMAVPVRKVLGDRRQLAGTISKVQRVTHCNQETVTITITRPLQKANPSLTARSADLKPVGACLQPVGVGAVGSARQSSLSCFRLKTVKPGELSSKETGSKCLTYVFR